jgi:hypothetical protein
MRQPTVIAAPGWLAEVTHHSGAVTVEPIVAWVVTDPIAGSGYVLLSDGAGGLTRPDTAGLPVTVWHASEPDDTDLEPPMYDPPIGDEQ